MLHACTGQHYDSNMLSSTCSMAKEHAKKLMLINRVPEA